MCAKGINSVRGGFKSFYKEVKKALTSTVSGRAAKVDAKSSKRVAGQMDTDMKPIGSPDNTRKLSASNVSARKGRKFSSITFEKQMNALYGAHAKLYSQNGEFHKATAITDKGLQVLLANLKIEGDQNNPKGVTGEQLFKQLCLSSGMKAPAEIPSTLRSGVYNLANQLNVVFKDMLDGEAKALKFNDDNKGKTKKPAKYNDGKMHQYLNDATNLLNGIKIDNAASDNKGFDSCVKLALGEGAVSAIRAKDDKGLMKALCSNHGMKSDFNDDHFYGARSQLQQLRNVATSDYEDDATS